jgi:hypothetical protein
MSLQSERRGPCLVSRAPRQTDQYPEDIEDTGGNQDASHEIARGTLRFQNLIAVVSHGSSAETHLSHVHQAYTALSASHCPAQNAPISGAPLFIWKEEHPLQNYAEAITHEAITHNLTYRSTSSFTDEIEATPKLLHNPNLCAHTHSHCAASAMAHE